jgi:hypothetical protein
VIEISKPKNTWCTFCDSKIGCTIYEERPKECATFNCLWLDAPVPWNKVFSALKPNVVKFVLGWNEKTKTIEIHPDPGMPYAWMLYETLFTEVGEVVPVVVFTKEGVKGLGPKAFLAFGEKTI